MEVVFWISIAIIFYAFVGYGMVLLPLIKLKRMVSKNEDAKNTKVSHQPEVSLVIPCYNEADIIREKAVNCLALDYNADRLNVFFITDGSTDGFREVLKEFPQINLLHEDRRAGKAAAENRAMTMIHTPIVVFSDANTLLNKDAITNIVRHFSDESVGCVSGEKRVYTAETDNASGAGEGFYWKYESFLKRLDSELYSAVGAAGELVAFRSDLYEVLPEDTILDDFMQSLLIGSKGYRIVYEPDAYAMETGSASVEEELKRKIRISAGGWQSMHRLLDKITPFKQPVLFFQYLSHRVLRWTITPFLLILVFFMNFALLDNGWVYQALFVAQLAFYGAAMLGYILENKQIRFKILFVPYYFCVMNYAVIAGLIRFLRGGQKGAWEKAKRKELRS
jgi:biofilm PGA synthesis N-glycosyltransferase PgaC